MELRELSSHWNASRTNEPNQSEQERYAAPGKADGLGYRISTTITITKAADLRRWTVTAASPVARGAQVVLVPNRTVEHHQRFAVVHEETPHEPRQECERGREAVEGDRREAERDSSARDAAFPQHHVSEPHGLGIRKHRGAHERDAHRKE